MLGGGVVQAGDLLLDAARATFADLVEGGDRRPLAVVVPAAFGERAGAVGAALAARQGVWLTKARAPSPGSHDAAAPAAARLRTGIVLPTFRDTPDAAFEAAAEAVAAGVDGLFCYDHIWPLGQPERPALAPFPDPRRVGDAVCAAADGGGPFLRHARGAGRAGARTRCCAAQFAALEQLAPGRVIAGLGTGDRLSEEENRAYGIPFAPAAAAPRRHGGAGPRISRGAGITVWMAGGPSGRTEEARAAGAALNVWDADPAVVAERGAGGPSGGGHLGRARRRPPRRPWPNGWPPCARPARAGRSSAGRST